MLAHPQGYSDTQNPREEKEVKGHSAERTRKLGKYMRKVEVRSSGNYPVYQILFLGRYVAVEGFKCQVNRV